MQPIITFKDGTKRMFESVRAIYFEDDCLKISGVMIYYGACKVILKEFKYSEIKGVQIE